MANEAAGINQDIWGVKELAQFLKVSRVTLYRLLEKGEIPCRKIGNQYRFYRPAVEEWLSFPLKARELSIYFQARDRHAGEYGLDSMSMSEIDREIKEVRKKRAKKK